MNTPRLIVRQLPSRTVILNNVATNNYTSAPYYLDTRLLKQKEESHLHLRTYRGLVKLVHFVVIIITVPYKQAGYDVILLNYAWTLIKRRTHIFSDILLFCCRTLTYNGGHKALKAENKVFTSTHVCTRAFCYN